MKIALTGPHCCGKSTVFRKLEGLMVEKEITFFHYDGNRCPIDYGDVNFLRANPDVEIDLTHWMLSDLIKREIEATQSNPRVALDRCVIDQLVYPFVILGEDKFPREIEEYARYWVLRRPYNLVFLFPRNEDLLKRFGKKDTNTTFLNKIDDAYKVLLDRYDVNYMLLPENQEAQLQETRRVLEDLTR